MLLDGDVIGLLLFGGRSLFVFTAVMKEDEIQYTKVFLIREKLWNNIVALKIWRKVRDLF